MRRWFGLLLVAMMAFVPGAGWPQVSSPPASTLPVAGPINYNFYDLFTGTLALVTGRTPDQVSNGNTWSGTDATDRVQCSASLSQTGTGSWNAVASIFDNSTALNGILQWNNNSVALTAGSTYVGSWRCSKT